VRNCAEIALAPFRLTPTQFLVLFRLKHSKGVSSAELARVTGVRPQSVAELIGPLELRGLITRKEAAEHRRILRISLSAAGEQLLARAKPVARQLEKELLANLTVPELTRLREGLLKLLANAESHETHPVVRRSAAAMRAEISRSSRKSSARSSSVRRRRSAQ
jgi:DNA-binding MarR family transcriptional regulator